MIKLALSIMLIIVCNISLSACSSDHNQYSVRKSDTAHYKDKYRQANSYLQDLLKKHNVKMDTMDLTTFENNRKHKDSAAYTSCMSYGRGYGQGVVKGISFNRYLLEVVIMDDIKEALRHEVAHAIQCIEQGYADHGPEWVKATKRTGAKPVLSIPFHLEPKFY